MTRRALTAVTAIMTADPTMTADTTVPRVGSDAGDSRRIVFTAGGAARGDHGAGVLVARPAGTVTVQDLLRWRAALPAGHPGRAALRTRGIEAGLALARGLAARYRGRGEPWDDLCQVAALALVKAVDGYDPTRQAAFTSYAVPTIVGALKRHFRDSTWRVRVPRRVQELAISLGPANAGLAQRLGRSPTLTELAAHLGAGEHDVAVAVSSWHCHHPESLDWLSAAGGDQRPFCESFGVIDVQLEAVTDWVTLQPLLAALPVRERRILAMRFFGDLTQAEIAVQLGVSQMHISRLLVRVLAQLRTSMLDDESPAPDPPPASRLGAADARSVPHLEVSMAGSRTTSRRHPGSRGRDGVPVRGFAGGRMGPAPATAVPGPAVSVRTVHSGRFGKRVLVR
jgi:RNA polymerase sigma-B factor